MKIVCMGDSITYGTGLENPFTQRWSTLVQERTGYEMINLGIGGDTTAGMLARCQYQVFPKKPETMLLMGGTNDICLTWEYRSACANIVSIVRHAQTENIPVMIGIPLPIVAEDVPVRPWDDGKDNYYIAKQILKYAEWLRMFCYGREISMIDFGKAFFEEDGTVNKKLFLDGIHPTAEGHEKMAEVLYRFLRKN